MRNMTPGIKQLFQTRHYIPCAAVCEGLLAQLDGQVCLSRSHALTYTFHMRNVKPAQEDSIAGFEDAMLTRTLASPDPQGVSQLLHRPLT